MKITKLSLPGVFLIEPAIHADNRGTFHRTFCKKIFQDNGLETEFVQDSVSFNPHNKTLRGMHFQRTPYEEIKLVTCLQGKIFDVIADNRLASKTYGKWCAVELSQKNKNMVYIPEGYAHGFLTLEPHSLIHYKISEYFEPNSASGFMWNDRLFAIKWPDIPKILSEKDKNYEPSRKI